LSEALVAMRLDAMMSGVPTRKIFPEIDNVEMKIKMLAKKAGNITDQISTQW
jgi:hypothetical protein